MSDDETLETLAAVKQLLADQVWPVKIELSEPIEFGKETITELVFRKGRTGDLRGMKSSDVDDVDTLLTIASRMCGKPVAVLELLPEQDGGRVHDLARGFFGRFLLGGRKL